MKQAGKKIAGAVLAVLLACCSAPPQAPAPKPDPKPESSPAAKAERPAISSAFAQLMQLTDARSARASSFDSKGGNRDWILIPQGKTETLASIEGAGCIRHFYWAYIIDEDEVRRDVLRNHILRIYWDGEEAPSVECPIGDLFGISGTEVRPIRSLALVVNPGFGGEPRTCGMNLYLPMPFSRGARVTLENDTSHAVPIWYHIDYETMEKEPPGWGDLGRFHAQFRRTNTTKTELLNGVNSTGDENYVILEAKGKGNLAGYMLLVDNVYGEWWGEGDDMIFLDGESWPPSFHGTGSEEIFGGGGCPAVEYTGPYTGFHLVENRDKDRWRGKNGMYRFFIADPVRFHKSIRVTIEHGHANDLPNDYSSVAYWYQREPHAPFPKLPGRDGRKPAANYVPPDAVKGAIEAERFFKETHHSGKRAREMRIPGRWSGGRLVLYQRTKPGDWITFPVEVLRAGKYRVKIYYAKGSDFGIVQLKIDGESQGDPWDAYNPGKGWGDTRIFGRVEADLGVADLTADEHVFRFEVAGKNPDSKGHVLGVDAILIEPVEQ